ncbi:cell envelope integrity protein TolA [Hymenobacter sp. BT523]|uniref:cell envelope integrity protein TolA n=1 Tax=Hymenobacter sp. BT523 TaxID=2795725 RepID=UPI0018EDBBD0|nr:cell envelope integrity protein TolA [Hymenobacter sp. BT523]MBJ6110403.1 cell envelope integrity protein TolA [Hymenobacter sp. BT523]
MKKLITLIAFGIGCVVARPAHAQGPDRAEYQQRFNDCNSQEAKLRGEVGRLVNDRDVIMQEFMNGEFCSDCKRSKTEVERQDRVAFGTHIAASKGRHIVRATQAEIDAKRQKLNEEVRRKEAAADAQRERCDNILASYDKAAKDAQARAQQEAERDAKQDADERARHEADEKQKQLAAAQQRAEAERQAREEERRRREEAERIRQAQLAANLQYFEDRVNSNNAETQAKLDEARRNGTLNGINQYSDDSRRNARNTVAGTSSGSLRRQAMDDGSGGFLAEEAVAARSSVREQLNSLVEEGRQYLRDKFVKEGNDRLWGVEDDDDDDNNGAPWTLSNLKKRASEALTHHVVERVVEMDKKNGGVLYKWYDDYKSAKYEQSLHEDRRLVDFHEDATNAIVEDISKFRDLDEYSDSNSASEGFLQEAERKLGGVRRKWTREGRRTLLDELVP